MSFTSPSSTIETLIESGNLTELQKLVDASTCNTPDETQRAPLYHAINHKQPEIARWLLSLGCDIDSGAEKPDAYVMEFVVSQLSEPLLDVFIDHGEALPSSIGGLPVLHALMDNPAITEGFFSAVLAQGGDINTVDMRTTQMTVLAHYVGQEQTQVDPDAVAWLIGLGADVNKALTPKATPLMRALMNPALPDTPTKPDATTFPQVLEQLAKGGDLEINLAVSSPCLAERILQFRRHASFVSLLEMGLEIADNDKPGLEKYLDLKNFGRSAVKALQAVNEKRQLGLPLGILINNVRQMQSLVDEMVSDTDDLDKTFIDLFKAENLPLDKKLMMLETLLDKGADINQGARWAGMTLSPLQILCGWFDTIDHADQLLVWLLDHGAAIECHDRSALCMALWFQRLDLVRQLADRGAELNYHGPDGSTIFTWLCTMTPQGGSYDTEERAAALRSLKQIFDAHQQPLPFTEEFTYNPDSPTDLSRRNMLPAWIARYKAAGFVLHLQAMIDCGYDINTEVVDDDGFHGNIIAIWGQYASMGEDISAFLKTLDTPVDVNSPQSGNPLRWLICSGVSVETVKCLLPLAENIDQPYRVDVGNTIMVALDHGIFYHILFRCHSKEGDAEKYQYCKDVCHLLLEHGADPNAVTQRELQPHILERNRWGQFRTEETLLEAAAQFDNIDVFRDLLDHGADPHQPMGITGEPFEIFAVSRFNDNDPVRPLKFLRELEQRGLLDLTFTTKINNTPLLAAAAQCFAPLVEYLLEKGADVTAVGGFDNSPALHRAISQWNHVDPEDRRKTVELLLKFGADPSVIDPDGDTALMSATSYGCLSAVEALLAHGVDVNQANELGFTALHTAAWRPYGYDSHVAMGREENCVDQGIKKKIIDLLLDHGAKIDAATNEEGFTPLTIAMLKGHDEIFVRLMKRGADITKTDARGRTPLMIAVEDADEVFMTFLTNSKTVRDGVEHRDRDGSNLMHYIALRPDETEARKFFKLFTSRLNLSYRANDKQITPLHYAAYRGHADLVTDMAALGVDINGADLNGNTPLHVALFFDPEEMDYARVQSLVTNLLAAGANPRLENNDGVTALEVASQRELKSCVERMSMVQAAASLN